MFGLLEHRSEVVLTIRDGEPVAEIHGYTDDMKFQISGLPRCGTAWITSVLNFCPSVICVHEEVDKNVPLPKGSYKSVGESGSHLLLPDFRNKKVDFRLFIYRDPNDSYNSLSRATGDEIPMDWWNNYLTPLAEEFFNKSDMVIEFKSLFNLDTVKKIWNKVTDESFEEDKVALMLGMNLQRNSLDYDFNEEFISMVTNHINLERRVA